MSAPILWSALVSAAGAAEVEITPSDLPAVRVDDHAVDVDGRLDEAAWATATRVTGLGRVSPVEDGQPAYGHCEFFVLYGEDALYIGARVDQPPGVLRAHVSPRDQIGSDDSVIVYLKPILQGHVGYILRVNALGIQRDVLAVGYTSLVDSWDGVWDSAGQPRPEGGYTVELRLPYRTFRFTGGEDQTWGLGFGQTTGSLGEHAVWPPFSSNLGHQFDQLGRLVGLRGITQGPTVDLFPSLVARLSGTTEDGVLVADERPLFRADQTGLFDVGVDAQVGVTSSLVANLTVNPDFSQVEADADQLEYDARFPLTLKEKRPFFMEGLQAFDTPVPLFYSRGVNDPIGGLKLTGAGKALTSGVFVTLDQDPPPSRIVFDPTEPPPRRTGFEDPQGQDALTAVGRFELNAGRGAQIGAFVANKEALGPDGSATAAHLLGAGDARLNFGEVYYLDVQAGGSSTGPAGASPLLGTFYAVNARRDSRNLLLAVTSARYDPQFRAETSVLSRVGYAPSTATVGWKIPTGDRVLYVRPAVTGALSLHATELSPLDRSVTPSISAQFPGATVLEVGGILGDERFAGHTFRADRLYGSLTSAFARWFNGTVNVSGGDRVAYDPAAPLLGWSIDGTASVSLRPSRLLQLETAYTKSLFALGGAPVSVDIGWLKVLYNVDSRWSIRGIGELNTDSDAAQASLLLSYLYGPGTAVWLGYEETLPMRAGAVTATRAVFLKVSAAVRP